VHNPRHLKLPWNPLITILKIYIRSKHTSPRIFYTPPHEQCTIFGQNTSLATFIFKPPSPSSLTTHLLAHRYSQILLSLSQFIFSILITNLFFVEISTDHSQTLSYTSNMASNSSPTVPAGGTIRRLRSNTVSKKKITVSLDSMRLHHDGPIAIRDFPPGCRKPPQRLAITNNHQAMETENSSKSRRRPRPETDEDSDDSQSHSKSASTGKAPTL
jgi:hypothetical protein